MALRFVKTTVLSSEDGLEYSKETAVESEEARERRLMQEKAANRPLYEQLAEQRDKKQEEYDAMTKLMHAPPKGLDNEEYSFLVSLNDRKAAEEKQRRLEEEKALTAFRVSRKAVISQPELPPRVVNSSGQKPLQSLHNTSSSSSSSALPPNIIRVKRKAKEDMNTSTVEPATKKQQHSEHVVDDSKVKEEKGLEVRALETEEEKNKNNSNNNALSSLLGDYGSDEDA